MNDVYCYAQRLLNPFRGVLQIIAYESAEAVSTDGMHWDIYVRNDELVKDLENSYQVQTSDIRYGSWSEDKGLKRGPVYPSEDFKRMEEMGAIVYEYLLCAHQNVPFPLQDRYELWLLDNSGQPLVLLDSAVFDHDLDMRQAAVWRAGLACREQFCADVMQTIQHNQDSAACAGEYLMQYINHLAGDNAAAQWFHRQSNGEGTGLKGINLSPVWGQRRLPEEAFPSLLLNDLCHDEMHSELVAAFLQWQAPWLLLLPGLTCEQRQALEHQARTQALEIEKHYRLYPEVIDAALIKAARVEAMMRRSQQDEKSQEDIMSTFYIELHPSPTE